MDFVQGPDFPTGGVLVEPPESIAELASRLLPDQSADIVVYCASPT